ncbi:MAG: polyphosphate polymerase domain-containing protein [Flavobacteriaceae bacterium]
MEKVADSPLAPILHDPKFRFERKFVFEQADPKNIIQRVLRNPFGFEEVFHLRKVNNIYFDDANFNFYKQNVEGVAERKKLRLRWYGNQTETITDPTVEIKIKYGEVGDKVSYKLSGTSFDLGGEEVKIIHQRLVEGTADRPRISRAFHNLQPTLLNTYERRYFLSFCGKYRITVDFNQQFFNPNYPDFEKSKIAIEDVIVELKYALEDDRNARQVSQYIGTRLSKNSKYVRGINLLYHPQF